MIAGICNGMTHERQELAIGPSRQPPAQPRRRVPNTCNSRGTGEKLKSGLIIDRHRERARDEAWKQKEDSTAK